MCGADMRDGLTLSAHSTIVVDFKLKEMKNYTQPPEPDVIFNSTMGFHMPSL